MRIEFHRTGAERKALVTAIGEILEVRPQYKGMPSAAYEIDYYTVTKDGTLEFDDRADSEEVEKLLEQLADRGIVAAPAEMAQASMSRSSPRKRLAARLALWWSRPAFRDVLNTTMLSISVSQTDIAHIRPSSLFLVSTSIMGMNRR